MSIFSSIGIAAASERAAQPQIIGGDVPFIWRYCRGVSIFSGPFRSRSIASMNFNNEPGLTGLTAKSEAIIDRTDYRQQHRFDPFSNSLKFICGNINTYWQCDWIVPREECETNPPRRDLRHMLKMRNEFELLTTRIKYLTNRPGWRNEFWTNPNIKSRRMSNIYNMVIEDNVQATDVVDKWTSYFDINFYPRALSGNKRPLCDISALIGRDRRSSRGNRCPAGSLVRVNQKSNLDEGDNDQNAREKREDARVECDGVARCPVPPSAQYVVCGWFIIGMLGGAVMCWCMGAFR
jgi:hypothetical protein